MSDDEIWELGNSIEKQMQEELGSRVVGAEEYDRRLVRAVINRTLRAAAAECEAITNGFVSDVNPDRSRDSAKGAKLCALHLFNLADQGEQK